MKIEFYNPKKLKIPLNLSIIVDNKYIIEYNRNYDVKSYHHLSYTFSIKLKDDILKIDDIQNIMMEISRTIISQAFDEGIELDLDDFSISKIDKDECIYTLLFYKN